MPPAAIFQPAIDETQGQSGAEQIVDRKTSQDQCAQAEDQLQGRAQSAEQDAGDGKQAQHADQDRRPRPWSQPDLRRCGLRMRGCHRQ